MHVSHHRVKLGIAGFINELDTTGALGAGAKQLVDLLCKYHEQGSSGQHDPAFRSGFLSGLSCALHRGNGDAIMSGLSLARAAEARRFDGRVHRR